MLKLRPDCEICGQPAEQLHHDSYDSVVMAGAMNDALVSLCCECHHGIEFDGDVKIPFNCVQGKLRRILKDGGKLETLSRINRAAGLIRKLNRALETRTSQLQFVRKVKKKPC